jgi:hypothetical protein
VKACSIDYLVVAAPTLEVGVAYVPAVLGVAADPTRVCGVLIQGGISSV